MVMPRKVRAAQPRNGSNSQTAGNALRSSVSLHSVTPTSKKKEATTAARKKSRGVPLAASTEFVPVVPDATQANLHKIDHLVVLMLENRSFDHMLGYLRLEAGRTEVDGLRPDMSNTYQGKSFPVHHLTQTAFQPDQDPCHDGDCVTEQLQNQNGGFVSNYAKTHPNDPDPSVVMGYFTGANLPVYDHLAREFAICQRWFASVDGATWPNRLYAVTGRADQLKVNKRIPIYSLPSFVRHLDTANVSWRWYCHDIATLRVTDDQYRLGHFDHFAYFDRRSLLAPHSFLDDAAAGHLPAISWIDPNFVDVSFTGPAGSNDDHPPSDVLAGQELVLKLYHAILTSPQWEKTLLVVVYDEHGGFYDHVAPPAAAADNPAFRSYGARVPALIVSPYTARGGVAEEVFDHTSLIKTILLRFCQQPDGTIPDMGARVAAAQHLGSLLTLRTPRKATPLAAYQHAIDFIAQWKTQAFQAKFTLPAAQRKLQAAQLNELQTGVVAAKKQLRAGGLPEGQP